MRISEEERERFNDIPMVFQQMILEHACKVTDNLTESMDFVEKKAADVFHQGLTNEERK